MQRPRWLPIAVVVVAGAGLWLGVAIFDTLTRTPH